MQSPKSAEIGRQPHSCTAVVSVQGLRPSPSRNATLHPQIWGSSDQGPGRERWPLRPQQKILTRRGGRSRNVGQAETQIQPALILTINHVSAFFSMDFHILDISYKGSHIGGLLCLASFTEHKFSSSMSRHDQALGWGC